MGLAWHLFWYRQLCSFCLLAHVLSFGNSLSRCTIFRQVAFSSSRLPHSDGFGMTFVWYRQLSSFFCWPMCCQDICLSATACQDVPSFGRWPWASLGYLIVMGLVWHLFWHRQLCSVGPCVVKISVFLQQPVKVWPSTSYHLMSLLWHLFWYRQLCSFVCWSMCCQDICLSATACQDVPSFGRWPWASLGYLIVMGLVWHLFWYRQLCSFCLLAHVLSRYLSFGNSLSRCTIFRQVALIGYLIVMGLVWHLFWYRQLCSFCLLAHVLSRYLSFGNSLSRCTIFRQVAFSSYK